MAEITISGTRVTSLSLLLPRVGQWTADVAADTDTDITGDVAITLDGRSWRGSVVRGGVHAGAWRGRIVGGAGLLAVASATALRGATLRLVIEEVCRGADVSIAADAGDLTAAAPRWHIVQRPAAHVVGDVARAAGYAWRVTAAGEVWTGAEAWPVHTPAAPVDVIDEAPETGRLELAGDVLGIAPGQTLALPRRAPVRVGCVEIRATSEELRAVVLAERTTDPGGRLLAAFEALVARAMRRVDYHARYEAVVVAQRADGTLDVVPDDTRIPSAQAVPYRAPPGLTFEVPTGGRVLLGYVGGDPARPFCDLFEQHSAVTKLQVNGGSTRTAREGDSVSVTVLANAFGAGTPPAPVTLSGTITSGSSALRLP